jgi:CelD/BcsL family acetyltransferase involved in cellulose biosynthesis
MEAAGEVRWVTARSDGEFERLIGALFELHAARWGSRGEAGMLGGGVEQFQREAAARLWRAGIAQFFGLVFEGPVAAVIYGFMDKGRFWSYQSGFDPQLSAFSPGTLILEYAMQQAIQAGCMAFDFLRGSEAYKRDWGAEFVANRRVILEGMCPAPITSYEAV